MKKSPIILITTIFLIAFILLLLLIANDEQTTNNKVCINNHCFNMETVKTQQERAKGLMYRKSLDKNFGMLFIFEKEDFYAFWMKNAFIPLDIIWIDKNDKVVYIEYNAQPCTSNSCLTYSSPQKALYILEINAGLAEEYDFREGNKVEIQQ